MDQGATPGGALGIYQIDVDDTPDVELEFLYRSFKSIELRPYLQPPATKVMVYPYKVVENGDVRPAFRISKGRGVSRVRDALDFSVSIDNQEENLRLKYRGQPLAYKLLEHRIAKGLVDFPKLSVYLVNNYDTLFNRRFDKRPFTAFGRQWYEYWRPRDLKVLTNNSRIVMPTLINKRGPRFAIDRNGLMSDHATLYLYRHNFESPRDCVQTCV